MEKKKFLFNYFHKKYKLIKFQCGKNGSKRIKWVKKRKKKINVKKRQKFLPICNVDISKIINSFFFKLLFKIFSEILVYTYHLINMMLILLHFVIKLLLISLPFKDYKCFIYLFYLCFLHQQVKNIVNDQKICFNQKIFTNIIKIFNINYLWVFSFCIQLFFYIIDIIINCVIDIKIYYEKCFFYYYIIKYFLFMFIPSFLFNNIFKVFNKIINYVSKVCFVIKLNFICSVNLIICYLVLFFQDIKDLILFLYDIIFNHFIIIKIKICLYFFVSLVYYIFSQYVQYQVKISGMQYMNINLICHKPIKTRFYFFNHSTQYDLHEFIQFQYLYHNISLKKYYIDHPNNINLNDPGHDHVKLIDFNISKNNPSYVNVIPNDNATVGGAGRKTTYKKTNQVKNVNNRKRKKKFDDNQPKKKMKKNEKFKQSFFIENNLENINCNNFKEHYCGKLQYKCKHCDALFFLDEQISESSAIDKKSPFSLCCGQGKYRLGKLPTMPAKLKEYLTENTEEAKFFREHVRAFNCAFAFTSIGLSGNGGKPLEFNNHKGSYKIQGQIYHRTKKYITPPIEGKIPEFLGIYFFQTEKELENRFDFTYIKNKGPVAKNVIKNIQKIIHELNPFVKKFKNAIQRQVKENIPEIQIMLKANLKPTNVHRGCYNTPTINEVAAIIPNSFEGFKKKNRHIIIHFKQKPEIDKEFITISETHPSYDPLQYPLMFPHGTLGWSPDTYMTQKGINFYQSNNNLYNDNFLFSENLNNNDNNNNNNNNGN